MNRRMIFNALILGASVPTLACQPCRAEEETDDAAVATELVWETDYAAANQQAERQKKMLLIHFVDDAHPAVSGPFLSQVQDNPKVREKLSNFVLLRLPLTAQVKAKGQPIRLLDHPSFAEMEKSQGLAVIDFANPDTEHYGFVVSTLPFKSGKYYRYNPKHVAVLLDLPPGTQTQRALVFAVRIHPEAPASTKGELDPHLVAKRRAIRSIRLRSTCKGIINGRLASRAFIRCSASG